MKCLYLSQAGTAVLFFPADRLTGRYDPTAMHEAEPAVDEKWVSQLWVRQGPPARMRSMAGRASANVAQAELEDSAAEDEHARGRQEVTAGQARAGVACGKREPRPKGSAGHGVWRFYQD